MENDYFHKKRIWITGASSGIGRAVALELAQRGAKVAISARNEKMLNDVAQQIGADKVLVVPLNVTDKAQNHTAIKKIQAQ